MPVWLVAVCLVAVAAPAAAHAPRSSAPRHREVNRLVMVRDDADLPAVLSDHRAHDARITSTYDAVFKGYAAKLSGAAHSRVAADPRVVSIQEDVRIDLLELPATGITRIDAGPTGPAGTEAGPRIDVGIAIIDTGLDPDHRDLNVVGGVDCSGDAVWPGFGDRHGHGTHVAGIAAARNDGVGVTGVAPGAPLWALRVFDSLGFARLSNVLCGLEWLTENAAAHGIRVVNMSLGAVGVDDHDCGPQGDAFHRAVCAVRAAGVTVVVAAGNAGAGITETVPAAYDEVLTVTAMADFDGRPGGAAKPECRGEDTGPERDDEAASFSNYAWVGMSDAEHTVAAPGVCITSSWPGQRYAKLSGTSMAAPHVTGLAAMCLATGRCLDPSPATVTRQLLRDAQSAAPARGFGRDPRSPHEHRYYGYLVVGGSP